MTRPAAVKQVDIERAIRAGVAAGLTVAEVVIEPRLARVKFGVASQAKQAEGPQPKAWPKE